MPHARAEVLLGATVRNPSGYAYRVKVGDATYDADFEPITKEDARYRRLWLSVIHRAVEEAEGVNCFRYAPGLTRSSTYRARKWLTTDTRSLRAVCRFAEVDVEKLLRVYRGKYGGNNRMR